MVSSVNPTGVIYTISLSNNSVRSSTLTKALASNKNPEVSVVRSAQGSRTAAAAKSGTRILQNMGTGFGIVNTATELLKNLREQLEDIKGDILSLENASPQILDIAEANYTNQVGRIFDILTNTNFAGKNLFDGTLANAPNVRLLSQNLPANAASLRVQTGIDSDSHIDITIPRMLSGDGTIVNAPVDGVFDPLFPVTNNTIAALAKLNTIPQTGVNANTIINPGSIPPNNTWDGINMAGSYGDQIRIIEQALPDNVSAEQDIIRDITIEAFKSTATAFSGSAESDVSAGNYLKYAVAVASTLTLSNNNQQDVDNAKAVIMTVVNAIYVTNGPANVERVKLENIPHDPTTTYAQQVLRNFVLTYFDLNSSAPNGGDRLGPFPNRLDGLIDGTGTRPLVNNIKSRALSNPIYIGSVKTLHGRIGAMQTIDNAIRSIDTATAQLNGQKSALNSAKATLDVLVTELSAAADNYLSADYEKIIPELTQLLREAKVLSLAFGLSERQINTIIAQMESAAAAA